jgi:allophanate hydrolase subunit 1
MSPESIASLLPSSVLALLFWSLSRNVAAIDSRLKDMAVKIDDLHRAETAMQVRVAELAVRVQHTEAMLAGIEVELEKMRESRHA